ncbi:MAG TPA: hypothetical protein VFJ90_09835 [Candidatus Didemnitutus sp.]|nr:hypothetical protein [Candidatus Didemnitutus sp.]
MHALATPPRTGALWFATLLLIAGGVASAQTAGPETTPVRPVKPEEMSQAELLQSYRTLQEQLRSAQLTIVNNRLDAEAAAHAQSLAAIEKLENLRRSIAAEREKEQAAAERADYERQRQQAEVQQSTRLAIWVATAFGGAGLLAMVITATLQRRALTHLTEVMEQRPPEASANPWLLPARSSKVLDQTVALSNQRLQSTIALMEQRIRELEQMTGQSPATPAGQLEPEQRPAEGNAT